MNAVRIRRRIESDTLHLPELRPMVGREVEIIVLDESPPASAGGGDYSLLDDLAEREAVDPHALKELRDASTI